MNVNVTILILAHIILNWSKIKIYCVNKIFKLDFCSYNLLKLNMDVVILEVKNRDLNVKAKDYLAQKLVSAVLYGKDIKQNLHFVVDYQTFRRAFNKAGSNTIIELVVEGEKEKHNVLVHDVDYNPVTDEYRHIDFISVVMGQEIHTHIPLEFVGSAPAVRELAGMFNAQINEVEVKCLPKNLVHSIEVDLEVLVDFNTAIRVKDLIVPEGMTIMNDLEDVVAAVMAPRVEEVEVATDVEVAPNESAESAESATTDKTDA